MPDPQSDPVAPDSTTGTAPRRYGESSDLEIPGWVWGSMIAAYCTFLGGLVLATGHDGEAVFALVIAFGFGVVYFGVSGLLVGLNPAHKPAAFTRGLGPLQTLTGPMNSTAVAAQVLTVPLCFAFFGLAFAVICAVT